MYILGISCFYHESAACLIKNGKVVAASTEERFSRKKHDSAFPTLAIDFCLKSANIKISDLDFIVFYEKPFWKFHRILMSTLATYPLSPRLFAKSMITWLSDKLWVKSIIAEKTGIDKSKILFTAHHISHASSAYFPSGFEQSAVLTFDGVGEWSTTTYGLGVQNKLEIYKEIQFPHSLGLLYSSFTAFLGFKVNDGEYKVMGMAPYGRPLYLDKIRKVAKICSDGSIFLDLKYFLFHKSTDKSFSSKFVDLFGKSRPQNMHFFTNKSGYPSYFGQRPKNYKELCDLNQKYSDIAASIQKFTEEAILKLAQTVYQETRQENLCIAGGVGLNSVANGVLFKKGPFKRVFIQPAAGDDGGALGAALYVYHTLLGKKNRSTQTTSYLGQAFSDEQIVKFLKKNKIKYQKMSSDKALVDYLARKISQKKVIGFFHGRSEWGPRALGSRSIIADPRSKDMKEIVNTKIKFREPYRPFAPVVLKEKAHLYFDFPGKEYENLTNFMLGVFPVKKSKKKIIPAVTHIDGSARPQTITSGHNARYYNLVKKFGDLTGVYVLLNTSFNLKGEPIVNSPQDAFSTFKKSGLDILALERYIVLKENIQV